MEKKTGPTVFDLLQPELMTVEELTEVLHSCCVSKNLTKCSKEELVEIFKRVALPLPQRTYKNISWREKLLSKKQKKRKISIDSSPTYRTFKSSENSRKPPVASSHSNKSDSEVSPTTPGQSRIKPPIDLINFERKVIKLNASSNKKKEDLDKIVIKDKSKEVSDKKSSESVKKSADSEDINKINGNKHKKIRISFDDESEKSTSTPKVVAVKRTSTSKEEVSEPKHKHKRVII